MKIKDFKEDFEFGKQGEKLFEKEILPIITERYGKINNLDEQKTKGDYWGETNGKKVYYEIKTRSPNKSDFYDITQEFTHTQKNGSPDVEGYIFKYGSETWIVYIKTEIDYGILKIKYPIFMYKPYELRKHIGWLKRFKLRSVENKRYTTWFICNITPEKLAEKIDLYSINAEKRLIKWN